MVLYYHVRMQKDFEGWNIIKQETENNTTNINVRTGEVRWCRFGVNLGREIIGKGQTFHRPVLILKKFSSETFLGLPISLQINKGSWYYTFTHDNIERSIVLNQARVFDRKRLEDKLFEISETELLNIKKAYCNLILNP
jgi:mRNA interferase MazF